MKLWLTKLSVVLITFMTFGVFIPPNYLDADASEWEVVVSNTEECLSPTLSDDEDREESPYDVVETYTVQDRFVSYVSERAKEQSLKKFGSKIATHVEDDFITIILPKIDEVINQLANETDEENLIRFEITERPSSGYGEKIFHIFDSLTGQDVARFHVKRVNHPSRGHSFNFHYHLQKDNFEEHYHLGDIYWHKNTPPKWMS